MSITIGRIANKFWSNSNEDMPNGFPIYEEQMELKSDTPNMNDFMSGTIYLIGDSWNHCKYEGAYYNLYIVHLVSHRKQRYCYRLERDLWMDVLIHRPVAVGDLANSNNDALLEANLNRTFSVLDNPARVITVNFGNVDFDWTRNFTFSLSTEELPQTVLSRDNFNNFVNAVKGQWAKDWKYVNDRLYRGKNSSLKEGTNDAVFILSYLEPSLTLRGWKHILRERINEFVKSIETDKGKELKLSKVNSESFKTSKLNGSYCITHKVDGISTTAENVRLKEIDLSGLKDIVAIKHYDLTEWEPDVLLGKGKKSGIFDIVDSKVTKAAFLAKIRRKAYIPIDAPRYKTPGVPKGFWSFQNLTFNWSKAQEPQRVVWSSYGNKGIFNLWFIDNVNFMVVYDRWDPSIYRSEGKEWVLMIMTFGFGAVPLLSAQEYNSVLRYTKENIPFEIPKPWISGYPTFENLKDPIVPFGFLIYGLQRRYGEWKRYEYIGEDTKRQVFYYSGIKDKLLEDYRNEETKWWSKIDDKLAAIQPTVEFTKFYLDNYNFSWLCFFSSTRDGGGKWSAPYLATDGWGTWKHTPNTFWVQYVLNRDLHNIKGKNLKLNPYSNQRYVFERQRVDENLNKYLNRSVIDLPEGLLIEKGDYFFSDQDYEILEYPTSLEDDRLRKIASVTPGGTGGGIVDPLLPYSFLVEDMMEVKGGKPFANGKYETMVLLCTTSEGGLEIRTLENFDRELTISSQDDEIVESVNGTVRRETRFTLIKKILGDFVKPDFKEFTDEHKAQVLHAFYKANGYKTKINKGVAHWVWFDESDFDNTENFQQLFDLVGTDWYAFVAKGKISLISKKETLFATQKGQSGKLLHEENKDLNLSLVEKINQKVRFQFFSIPYYLNWKSTFSDKDRIDFSVETIPPTELQTNFDQFFIKLDTGFDTVYYENVSLAKKQTKALSPADSVQLEKLNLDLTKAQYSYQIDADKLKIAEDRYHETIRRAETDLYHQRLQSWISLGTFTGATGVGTGIAMKYREGAKTVTTIGKGATLNPHYSLGFAPGVMPFTQGSGVEYGFESVPMDFKEITKVAGKTPNIAGALVAAGIKKVGNLIMDHAFRFPEEARRIGVEKQIGAAELALQSLAMNTKYIEKQINAQLAINQKTNIYSNPIINERELMETFMEKDNWHGKKLKPAHLVCFVPSEEQLIALKEFKDQYGVMCDIPNVTTRFYEGMEPDFIRYRNLDDDAIKGFPNEWMRAFLRAHLLAGIKIRKVTKETFQLLSADDFRDKIFRLNTDLHRKAEEVDAKDKQIVILNTKVNTIEGTVRQEYETKDAEQKKKIREIEDQINLINAELRKKIAECKAQSEQSEKDKEEINKLKIQKEQYEQQLADARRRAINEQDEINRLKKQKEDLEKKLEEAKKKQVDPAEIKGLQDQIDTLQKARSDLQKQKAQSEQELNKRINDLNMQVTRTNNQIESQKTKITNLTNKRDQLAEQVRKLKADLANAQSKANADQALQNQVADLNKQIAEKEAQLEKVNAECEKVKNELTEKQTALENEIRQHKVDKEDLTQQLNDERIKVLNEKDEVNKLKKQLEEKGKQPVKENCEFAASLLEDAFLYDFGERYGGWSVFLDLVFAIATAMKWEGRAQLDQRLLTIRETHAIMELLEELKGFVMVDKAIDIVQDKDWPKLVVWRDSNSLTNEGADRIIREFEKVKDMQTNTNALGLKAILDELNYEVYKFYKAHWEKFKNNGTIIFLFKHVYPGKAFYLYQQLYVDQITPLVRKKFIDYKKEICESDSPEPLLVKLEKMKAEIESDMKSVLTDEQEPLPQPEKRDDINYPGFQYTKFLGKHVVTGQRFDIPPVVWWFYDAKKVGDRGNWTVESKYTVEQSGNQLQIPFKNITQPPWRPAITFWNYPYYKIPKNKTDLWNRIKKVVYYRTTWVKNRDTLQDTYKHYMETVYYPSWEMFRKVWNTRNFINVPHKLLKAFAEGQIIFVLKANFLYSTSVLNQTPFRIRLATDVVEMPDEDLEDFLKFLFIMEAYKISAREAGRDQGDDHWLIGWEGGMETSYYLYHGRWQDGDPLERFNTKISSFQWKDGDEFNIDLGLWFNGHEDIPEPWKQKGWAATVLQYFKYIKYWGHVTCPHPFELNNGAADEMFRTLDEVRKAK